MDLNPFRRRVFNHIPRVGRLGGLESVYVDSFSRHEHLGLERLVGVFAKLAGINEVGMREVQLVGRDLFVRGADGSFAQQRCMSCMRLVIVLLTPYMPSIRMV